MTKLPALPEIDHLRTVVVTFGNTIVWATVLVLASSPKVLAPAKVSVDAPVAPPIVKLLYVNPPPKKVRALVVVLDRTIGADAELNVRFVVVLTFQTLPTPLRVHVPDPIVTVRAIVPEALNSPVVTAKLLASKAPDVTINVRPEPSVIFAANCRVPVTAFNVIGCVNATPAEFMVLVTPWPAKVNTPVPVSVKDEKNVRLP